MKGISVMLAGRAGLIAAAAVVAVTTIYRDAEAQGWYIVNGQPAPPALAQYFAARNLPYGQYWLQQNGNWGFVGNPDTVANLNGRRPSLSERGMLFSPGELMR